MKPSPICLGDYEAIERVAMESGKQRQREDVVERYRFQHQPILMLLVTKYVDKGEPESKLAELHRYLQFPDAGEAQVYAVC
jgi:hypothetical protein